MKKATAKAKVRAKRSASKQRRTPAPAFKIIGRGKALSKIAKAKAAKCPTCHAKPGNPCKGRGGVTMLTFHRLRFKAMPAKLQPLAPALAKLVTPPMSAADRKAAIAAKAGKGGALELHKGKGGGTIAVSKIIIGKRHRRDFSHVPEVAKSIDECEGLILPVALTPDRKLIDGEVRIKAWKISKYAGQPIPFYTIDIHSILKGEWDANDKRKGFTLTEAVAIKQEVETEFRKLQAATVAARPTETRAAPGRKATPGKAAGRVKDKIASYVGVKRRRLDKAEAVVKAAEADPKRYGDLVGLMNKSGNANAAFKTMNIRRQVDALKKSPPTLPANGPYKTAVFDHPWPHEGNDTQESIDKRGRSLRPYPAMAIEAAIPFYAEKIAPLLADDFVGYFCCTNHALASGQAHKIFAAMGFMDGGSTILTWDKVIMGRGQILREVTEQVVILIRGKPLLDLTGKNPPTTLLTEKRRENSRKPVGLFKIAERISPAERYASFFSRGGEGERWDSFGDDAKRFGVVIEPESELQLLTAIAEPGNTDTFFGGKIFDQLKKAKLIMGAKHPKLTKAGMVRLAQMQAVAKSDAIAAAAPTDELGVLEQIAAGFPVGYADARLITRLSKGKLIRGKLNKLHLGLALTKAGQQRMAELTGEREDARQLAALPEDLEQLVVLYGGELKKRHDAIMAGSEIEFGIHDRGIELMEWKANGGKQFGSGTAESPAEQLRARNAAPVGAVPMWGQRGIFRITLYQVPYIITHDEDFDFEMYAENIAMPFPSDTGYRNLGRSQGPAFTCTVGEQALAFIKEDVQHVSDGTSGKRKTRKALPMPHVVHRMPVTWDDTDDGKPVQLGHPPMFERREGEVDPGKLKDAPAGHVVVMTLDWSAAGKSRDPKKAISVGRCGCGEVFRAARTNAGRQEQDAAIAAHWAAVRLGSAVVDAIIATPKIAADAAALEQAPVS